MTEKHYPYCGGSFDRIIFDKDGSVWVPEAENAKLRELVREIWKSCPVSEDDCAKCPHRLVEDEEEWCDIPLLMEQLGVLEVDA